MQKHIRFWLLLLASLWLAASAWAQSYYVDITNRTGFVITHIYISPADSSSWEADVLGNKVLARDATQRVTLNGYRSPIFDIKLSIPTATPTPTGRSMCPSATSWRDRNTSIGAKPPRLEAGFIRWP